MIQDPFVHLVELLDAHPAPGPEAPTGHWPCPGCGRSRPAGAAWAASVRNQVGPAHRRELRLCTSCVRELRPDHAVGTARTASSSGGTVGT